MSDLTPFDSSLFGWLLGLVATIFSFVLGSHEKKISDHSKDITGIKENVAQIAKAHELCREEVKSRLESGDSCFNEIKKQVDALKTNTMSITLSVRQLGMLNRMLAANIKKIDDRQWGQANHDEHPKPKRSDSDGE